MDQFATHEDEATLRRRLQDLGTLCSLSSRWENANPEEIRGQIADTLLDMLDLDAVWIGLAGGEQPEIVRSRADDKRAIEACQRFAGSRDPARAEQQVCQRNGKLRLARMRMGKDHFGSVVVASRRPGFPTETEWTLIEVAARQTAAAIERWRGARALHDETQSLELLYRTGAAVGGNLALERIVQTVTDAATELSGAQFGAFFYNVIDDEGESYTLYSISGAPREAFSGFPLPRNTEVFEPTFRGTGIVRSADITRDARYGKNPPYCGMPEGHLPVRSYLAVPIMSRSGKVLGGLFFGHAEPGVFTDRSERVVAGIAAQASVAIDNANLVNALQTELQERRRFEEHQKLLLAELSHRVKNTLAIVQAIATQTLRHATSARAFREGFEARVMALAQGHDLLTEANWRGTAIGDVVARVLGPYRDDHAPRYALSGDAELRVDPQAAVQLVLALHELATNAAKYGAFSSESGRVMIDVARIERDGKPQLSVRWEETGGPRVRKPGRRGFGSRLIRGLSFGSQSKVELEFHATGVVCTFVLPLTEPFNP